MKQKIDRLAGAIVLGFHIYCDVILGAVLAVVGAAGFYHSFFIRIMREPVAAVDTARFFPQLVFGALIPVGIVMALLGIRKIKVNRLCPHWTSAGQFRTGIGAGHHYPAQHCGIYCLDGAPGIYSYCDPVYGVQHVIYVHEGWLETRDLRCDCSCGRHSVFLPVREVRVC